MQDLVLGISQWATATGDLYGVNPIIFAVIYLGTVPPFWYGLYWLSRNVREGISLVKPLVLTFFSWSSCYIYVFVVGESVPFYFWIIIAALMGYTLISAKRKLKRIIGTKAEMDQKTQTILFSTPDSEIRMAEPQVK